MPCFNLEKSSTPRSTFCLPSPTCLLKNSKSADSVLFCFRDACAVALPHAHLPRACALVRCVPPPCPRSRDQRFVPSARPVSPRGRAPRNGTCDAPRSCSSSPHLRSDGASLLLSRAGGAGFACVAGGIRHTRRGGWCATSCVWVKCRTARQGSRTGNEHDRWSVQHGNTSTCPIARPKLPRHPCCRLGVSGDVRLFFCGYFFVISPLAATAKVAPCKVPPTHHSPLTSSLPNPKP